MSSDIVVRLRELFYPDQIEWEAADEIERLRAECDNLRYELSLVAHERALAESEEARRER